MRGYRSCSGRRLGHSRSFQQGATQRAIVRSAKIRARQRPFSFEVKRGDVMLVSVAQAAAQLQVAKSTIYGLVRRREITCVRVGDRILLDITKIIAALEIPADTQAQGPSG